jgi:DNA-binding LacI/PurR family transcriptional regulator
MVPRAVDGQGVTGVAGRRQLTMADIASEVGVSRQLVSLVLRGAPGASAQTRQRVLDAVSRLGYSPHLGAQVLRQAESRHLGVVFAPTHATEPDIVEAMYPAAAAQGHQLILSATTPTRDYAEAVGELAGYRCAALVVIGADLGPGGLTSLAQRSRVPLVVVGDGRRNPVYDVVRSAGDRGVEAVVHHLADLRHRRIVFTYGTAMRPSRLRLSGYRRAIRNLGLAADILAMPGDYTEEHGAMAARALLARDELPTAVAAANDQFAVGLMLTLARAGVRVPEDVSVTGFDDIRFARLSAVDLTTVRQDPADMGRAAVAAALRRVDDPDSPPQERVIEPTLVVRSSTASPRG